MSGAAATLRAVGLHKGFPSPVGAPVEVLGGVDLVLRPGEQVAVVGRSGSGKSTLLNLLGCLDRADAGEVWYGDLCLTRAGRRARARFRGGRLGFVFQSFNLIAGLTAWENVLLAGHYVGRGRAEAARTAQALMERLGVASRAAHRPPELSGGEQQRVAFCRAVLNDPAIILADEPTGNLDEENAAVILAELAARARAGAAVILVTHSPDLARSADRVLHLAAGRLVEGPAHRP